MTDLLVPRSLPELWAAWAAQPEAALCAGGTDLLVRMRAGLREAPRLICLERVPELQAIEDGADAVRIGAGIPISRLLSHPLIRCHFPVLERALRELGSPPIRNAATIGGNICTASPAGDTLPPLYVLDATLELESEAGVRRLPIREFILGPGRTALGSGELVRSVVVPKPMAASRHHFEKVGQRRALAIAVVSLAALFEVGASGVVQRARLAWGSVGPGIVTCSEAESSLVGKPLSPPVLEAAARAARAAVTPISDLRASADYRRQVAGNLLLRLASGDAGC